MGGRKAFVRKKLGSISLRFQGKEESPWGGNFPQKAFRGPREGLCGTRSEKEGESKSEGEGIVEEGKGKGGSEVEGGEVPPLLFSSIGAGETPPLLILKLLATPHLSDTRDTRYHHRR